MKKRNNSINFRKVVWLLISLPVMGLAIWQTGLSTTVLAESSETVNQLNGQEAVEYLKVTGNYQSLTEALRLVKEDEPPAGEAVSFSETAKLIAADGSPSEFFGFSVALSGETAILGSHRDAISSNIDQGSAYIFVKSGNVWSLQQKITAGDGAAGDEFGYSVAIDGNTAIVGAAFDDIGNNSLQGSAYIFVRNGTTWTQQAKLTAADGAGADNFGISVDISGNTVVAGAWRDDNYKGSAYVFVRSGATWTQQQKLTAADGAEDDEFGKAVAISGETVVIASHYNSPGGSAYVFTRTGSAWTQQAKLKDLINPSTFRFAEDVDIAGNCIIVGSLGRAASIFVRNGTAWTQQQRIVAGENLDRFAERVSISGDLAVVGANWANIGSQAGQGAAYVFERTGAIWTQRQKLVASDGNTGDSFGYGVDIDGNRAVITTLSDSIGTLNQGLGYVFENNSVTPNTRKAFDFDGDSKTDVGIFRPSTGEWWYLRSSDGGNRAFQFGASSDKIVPADYTGDGKTDVGIFRPLSGEWFILRSENASFYSFPFGSSGDIQVPSDFDGDGKADPAVFRPSDATWYIIRSSDGSTTIRQFGANGDRPIAADYDGDGKADLAIFRPSDGTWWINRSGSQTTVVFSFGVSTDKTVPADYTGDGKADVAFWRPSSGEWFILRSEDASFYSAPFGASGDIPAPGDYDGDGRADLSVFRPSNNTWYINRTTAGIQILGFGASGDIPVPHAFVR